MDWKNNISFIFRKAHRNLRERYETYVSFLEATKFTADQLPAIMHTDDKLIRHLTFDRAGPLGGGMQGRVYKVRCNEFNHSYAMKCIQLGLKTKPDTVKAKLEETLKEAKTLLQLEHKNIVQYTGFFEEEVEGFKVNNTTLI